MSIFGKENELVAKKNLRINNSSSDENMDSDNESAPNWMEEEEDI